MREVCALGGRAPETQAFTQTHLCVALKWVAHITELCKAVEIYANRLIATVWPEMIREDVAPSNSGRPGLNGNLLLIPIYDNMMSSKTQNSSQNAPDAYSTVVIKSYRTTSVKRPTPPSYLGKSSAILLDIT